MPELEARPAAEKRNRAAGSVLTHHRTEAGHPPQRQVDVGWVVVHQIGKAQLQQGGSLPGIDPQLGQAIYAQHPRRRELNGSQDNGQKHGCQPEIRMPYQRPVGVWE